MSTNSDDDDYTRKKKKKFFLIPPENLSQTEENIKKFMMSLSLIFRLFSAKQNHKHTHTRETFQWCYTSCFMCRLICWDVRTLYTTIFNGVAGIHPPRSTFIPLNIIYNLEIKFRTSNNDCCDDSCGCAFKLETATTRWGKTIRFKTDGKGKLL